MLIKEDIVWITDRYGRWLVTVEVPGELALTGTWYDEFGRKHFQTWNLRDITVELYINDYIKNELKWEY